MPLVAMVQPADFGPCHHTTSAGGLDGARLRRVLAEREVRSRALVAKKSTATVEPRWFERKMRQG